MLPTIAPRVKLQLYILRQLTVAFVFAVVGLLFIALPGIAVSAVHKLPNTDAWLLMKYLPLVLQGLAPYVLPMCFLLAVVATFGRLAADNEWTSIQMAGVRPSSLLFSPMILGLVLGGATYWMLSTEIPNTKRKEKLYLVQAASSAIRNLSPGRTSLQLGGFYIDSAFREGPLWRDVLIHKPGRNSEGDLKAFARSAVIEIEDDTLFVDLEDVEPLGPDGEWTGHAGRMTVTVPLSEFVTPSSKKFVSERYQTSTVIKRALREGTVPEDQIDRYKYEIHRRYATASTLLLFLLLGAPTGIMLRRGTQLGALAVAVVYALVYYVLSLRLGKELARDGTIPPEIGAWATIGMGTVLGMILVHKAFRR